LRRARRGRRLGRVVGGCLLAALPARIAGAPAQTPPAGPPLWFPVGEELVYRVYWGLVPVGTARSTTEWIEEDGRVLLAVRYRARSNRVLSRLYPVDDRVEAVIDPVAFRPVRFAKNLKEGRHRTDERTVFDYERLTAHWESRTKKKTKEYAIYEDTRDLVTFMYFMRAQRFTAGTSRRFRVMDDDKLYDLTVKALEEESVELPGFGKVACLKLEPEAEFQGLFVRKGRMFVWIAQGERMLVTKVVASLPVANVRAVLAEVRGPGQDFWVARSPRGGEAEEGAED